MLVFLLVEKNFDDYLNQTKRSAKSKQKFWVRFLHCSGRVYKTAYQYYVESLRRLLVK